MYQVFSRQKICIKCLGNIFEVTYQDVIVKERNMLLIWKYALAEQDCKHKSKEGIR